MLLSGKTFGQHEHKNLDIKTQKISEIPSNVCPSSRGGLIWTSIRQQQEFNRRNQDMKPKRELRINNNKSWIQKVRIIAHRDLEITIMKITKIKLKIKNKI